MKKNNIKSCAVFAAVLIFAIAMLTACGGSTTDETATTEASSEKATVTAGEAAEKEATKETQKVKTGTEDPAIDGVKAYAEKHIKGFDGSWENVEMEDFDDTIVIGFDFKGQHYEYTYDMVKGKVVE